MDTHSHWEAIYRVKTPSEMSWFRPHLETSLALIQRAAATHFIPIIDVGGGESTLIDDLMCRRYQNLTLLDISQDAIEHTRKRLGIKAEEINCISGDVLTVDLPKAFYGVWHDRAVFHFLTEHIQRLAYLDQVISTVKPGGHVVVGTFGPEGPQKCSGLDVQRYDSDSLQVEFGPRFHLIESSQEMHQTPFGTMQQFLYCHFSLRDSA